MSKYYKAEDVIDTLAEQWHFEATIDCPYAADDIEEWKENARELFADLPTIEVSEDCINGFREGQKDMLMFLLEGMKNALEKARTVGENQTTEQSSIEIEDENPVENLIDTIYPVGSCYFNNYGLATNPNDEFYNTTWEDCGGYWKRVK